MPLKVIVGSATKDAARADFYVGTAKKRVTRIEAYNGSAWKLVQSFAPPISLSISPASANGAGFTVPRVVTTDAVTAIPVGGTAPYSYAWAYVSGDVVAVTSPTLATTTFSLFFAEGGSASASYECTVTDSLGLTAAATVAVSLINTGSGV